MERNTQTTLRELKMGDVFYSIRDKKKRKFQKYSKNLFNSKAGQATCLCDDLEKKERVSKACNLNVIFLRRPE